MKTLSMTFRIIIVMVTMIMASSAGVWAQKKKGATPPPDIHAITKAENIVYPAVPDKQQKFIADYMLREAQNIVKQGYQVETERNGEVVVVTIPASELFTPNSVDLEVSGQKLLEPFTAYLKSENRFKLLLAMHSDDTGSESYLETLTSERLKAVMDYIESHSAYHDRLIGYALAADEPVRPNSTIANRAKNRRLEIYIVPDEGLINQSKSK